MAATGHGPHIALRHDAIQVVFRLGLQPNRQTLGLQFLPCLQVHDDAAGGGDDGGQFTRQSVFQGTQLVALVGQWPIQTVYLVGFASRQFFNIAAEFYEMQLQLIGNALANGGFTRPAQTHQRNFSLVEFGLGAEQLCQISVDQLEFGVGFVYQQLLNRLKLGLLQIEARQQIGDFAVQCLRHLQQDHDGSVARTRLQRRQMTF